MAKCELIRNCANYDLLEQISNTSDQGQRVALGNQFTAQVVACLNNQGVACKQTGADRIDFGVINGCHIEYDVIENLKGTKGSEARVSCHKNLSGNCGGEAGAGFTAGEQTSYNQGYAGSTGAGFLPTGGDINQYLPFIAGGLVLLLLMRK